VKAEGAMLRLTDAVNSQNGTFFIEDINGGKPVDQLHVKFDVRIGDSTCCDDAGTPRPADGK